MEELDKVKSETGRTVLYAVNISAAGDRIVERAREAARMGANMLMIDVIVCGLTLSGLLPGNRASISPFMFTDHACGTYKEPGTWNCNATHMPPGTYAWRRSVTHRHGVRKDGP
jgi:hypothetical protein